MFTSSGTALYTFKESESHEAKAKAKADGQFKVEAECSKIFNLIDYQLHENIFCLLSTFKDNVSSVSSAECFDDEEPLSTADKTSSNKPTSSINNAGNNDNQNSPGSTRRQSPLANATLIYPATGRNNLFPTT